MKLNSILSSVQLICEAIASVVHIDVTIVDSELVRLAGTGRYKESVGNVVSERSAFSYALSGSVGFVIENPGEHQACIACDCKSKCTEHAEMCCPILLEGEVVGVIGLIAFEANQRSILINGQEDLMSFLRHMADLIASKLKAQEAMLDVERVVNELQIAVDSMDTGFLAFDPLGNILRMNDKMKRMLGRQEIKALEQLFPEEEVYRLLKSREPLRNVSFTLPSGAKAVYDNSIIYVQGVRKGAVLTVKRMEEIIKTVNDMTLDVVITRFFDIIGESSLLVQAKSTASKVATKNSNVLILGESGTGKELFARAIHAESSRSNGPFIAINCAAIPDALLESELFGYEEGAFTGARVGGKPGKFQLANGGTLFLDEIGEMPLHLQVKLLRVLQDQQIEPVGGKSSVRVDVRIIAATHQDLDEKVKEGLFRADLYYRLNVIPVNVPPLRDRLEDLNVLVPHLLRKSSDKLDRSVSEVSKEVMDSFMLYSWPGNVRELENVLEYAVNMAEEEVVSERHLPKRFSERMSKERVPDMLNIEPLDVMEKRAIENAIKHYGKDKKSVERAANALGLSRATMYRKLKAYGIET